MILPMKKNRMRRTFIFILIAAILLTMQGFPVLAETEAPEQAESQTETEEVGQPEDKVKEEEPKEPEDEVKEEPKEPEDEVKEEEPEERADKVKEEEPKEPVDETETAVSEQEENKYQIAALEQPDETETEEQEEAETPIEQSVEEANLLETTGVSDDILAECIVPGLNPPGVIVNLFDYWQDNPEEAGKEVPHDYYYKYWDYDNSQWVDDALAATYDLGISRGHLLRFGYTNTDDCPACEDYGMRGIWNMYSTDTLCPEIVQNRLAADGFPVLNLSGKDYEQYTNAIDSYQTEESLAYLFSPYVENAYKESHSNVQGLFQKREDGSYYYNSTQNFASYNAGTNSFILYNSPGVAKEDSSGNAGFCGQFFPFNTAQYVFNNYTDEGNGNYRLDYQYLYVKQDENAPNYFDYNSISDGKCGYMKCYAPDLNHYLGMTMEMQFLQPEGGYLANGADTPMTFKFSGDDDVWIFIDNVLVADLGGLHDACELKIDFSDGSVYVQGAEKSTLLEAFQAVYGSDSNPGGIEFRDNTFADNTEHTLKMFYLERGHMASNLYLDFNIQTLKIEEGGEEEPDGDTDEEEPDGDTDEEEPDGDTDEEESNGNTDENVEDESYSEEENADENPVATVQSIILAGNNEIPDSIGIPKTGDDSLIGWWAALSIVSLLGIGATVCNLIITRKKQKK